MTEMPQTGGKNVGDMDGGLTLNGGIRMMMSMLINPPNPSVNV
jgi:hypothetical protein